MSSSWVSVALSEAGLIYLVVTSAVHACLFCTATIIPESLRDFKLWTSAMFRCLGGLTHRMQKLEGEV